MIESRNQRLLREFNERCERYDRRADNRWPLVWLILAVVIIGLSVAVLFSGAARGEAPPGIRVQVPCLKEVCLIEESLYRALVESHNELATRKPVKCKAALINEI